MKKILFLSVVAIASAVSLVLLKNQRDTSEEVSASNSKFEAKWERKTTSALGFAEWRNSNIINVNTGEVDPQDYQRALAQADQFKTQNAANKTNALGLEWVSRGPDNQGGRTRAIMFDINEPNTYYAGGVSGGLYKSIDAGKDWFRVEAYNGNNAAIMSLAQSIDGTIFVGTGEALANQPTGTLFNASIAGDGMYKSSDNGATWSQIDDTKENANPSFSGQWTSVRAIAPHPSKANVLLVGNNNGVRISTNADESQPTFVDASGVPGNVSDVVITADGKEAWASAGGRLFKSSDEQNNFSSFTLTSPSVSASRAQVAVSSVEANGDYIVYGSFTDGGGCLSGIFKSEDKGSTWTQIAFPGGLDPFTQPSDPGGDCQGWYDQCIAVNPADKDKIYIGGITFYTWGAGSAGLKRADQIDNEASSLDPNYIHADKHTIRFSPHDLTGNTFLLGGDGGITKCGNANSGFPDNMVYTENNKNYITLQCYSIGQGKYGEVVAGAQDNGTQYVDYKQISPQASKEVSTGDGVAGAEISKLSPDIIFSGSQFGSLRRSVNNGNSATAFVDPNIDPAGCSQQTCSSLNTTMGETCADKNGEGQNFIYHFFLMETYDRLSPRNDMFVYARDEQILLPGGDTLFIKDTIPTGDVTNLIVSNDIPNLDLHNIGKSFTLNSVLLPGDTAFFENTFDAKYFVSSLCGDLFVCRNPLQVGSSPVFDAIPGISSVGNIQRMDASRDGDMLVAVGGNRVTIIQGLDAFDGTNTNSLQITQVSPAGAGPITGVSVDKNNKNHVLISESGYGGTTKVFVSNNAASGSPSFTALSNSGLPEMPIYSCVIDEANDQRYILGTELGVWASDDGGVTWTEENNGMGGRFPIYALRQSWMNNFDCQLLTAGSLGAGMYTSTTIMDCAEKNSLIWGRPDFTPIAELSVELSNVVVYPNPVVNNAKIAFNLDKSADVTIKIVDLTGKLVSQKIIALDAGEQKIDYDMTDVASSTYFVVVSTDGVRFNNRLFIKK